MRINAVAFSTNGCRTAIRLKAAFPEEDLRIFCKHSDCCISNTVYVNHDTVTAVVDNLHSVFFQFAHIICNIASV